MGKENCCFKIRPIYFVILSIICITFFSGCCCEGIDIKVKKNMSAKLDKYHLAAIVVQDYKYGSDEKKANRDMLSDNSNLYIDNELFRLLREKGVEVTYGDKDPIDLKVECFFRQSFGCIHVGRHFNTEYTHVSFINLKFMSLPC